MADVDPIIAQGVIESEGLFEDSITERIFLSPLAEKQWREDFSGYAQMSKIFLLYLSKYNAAKSFYVTSLISSSGTTEINEDEVFVKNYKGENFINYRGLIERNVSYNTPLTINIKEYSYSHRVFDARTDMIYFGSQWSQTRVNALNYDLLCSLREVAIIDSRAIPTSEPDNFYNDVADVVVGNRSHAIEDNEMLLNNQKRDYKRTEASLESMRKAFNELLANNPADNLETQIKSIQKFPSIREVMYTQKDLVVYTEMLDIGVTDKSWMGGEWADVTMPLGEFEIRFELENILAHGFNQEYMYFINITEYERGSSLIHPHIRGGPNGPCLSEWKENFIQAGNNFSVIGLVTNAINYLRTFNPEDEYGENIHEFPGASVFAGVTNGGRIEYEDGDYERPGWDGEWQDYVPRDNGEWRDCGWEWYDEENNGEYRFGRGEWFWYDEIEGIEGTYDPGYGFYWYEDDEDYVNVEGVWIYAAENSDFILVDGEWHDACNDTDYVWRDDEWTHIDNVVEEEEGIVA